MDDMVLIKKGGILLVPMDCLRIMENSILEQWMLMVKSICRPPRLAYSFME